MSYYNAEDYIERAIDSIETSMKGKDWVIIFCGDGEQKHTESIIQKYSKISSSKEVIHNVYPKAINVSTAKNRAIKEALIRSGEYPGLLVIDADDEMLPERPRLIETAIKYNTPFNVGAWEYEKGEGFSLLDSKYGARTLGFTSCCTLIHESIIPRNGRFFYDKVISYGDVITWHYLRTIKKINPQAHEEVNEPVHKHYKIPNSITNPSKYKILRKKRIIFDRLKGDLKRGINIFDNPPNYSEDSIDI